MKIITGRTGQPHVTSQQQRDTNASLIGAGDYVLNVGKQLRASVINANLIRVFDGQLSMQGCIASIDANEYEEIRIENGSIGYMRCDLICACYQRMSTESENIKESVILKIIQGEKVTALLNGNVSSITVSPPMPQINNEISIRDGAVEYFFPLYKVLINELNQPEITQLFTVFNDDTDWQGVTFASDFQNYSQVQVLKYRKIGNRVEIRGAAKPKLSFTPNSINVLFEICRVPPYCAPKTQIVELCQGSGLSVWTLEIHNDGILYLSRYRTGNSITELTSDTWLPMHVFYYTD